MRIQEFISKSYVFAIAHGYDVVWRKFNIRLKTHGCNINEALVLIALFFEETAVNPSVLASTLRTSRGNISHCLAKLERQKFVRRTLSEHDARRLSVALTPSGSKLAQKLIGEINGIEDYCEAHFSMDDQGVVLKSLFSLSKNI